MELAILLQLVVLAEEAYRAFAKAKGMDDAEQDTAIKEARKALAERGLADLKEV